MTAEKSKPQKFVPDQSMTAGYDLLKRSFRQFFWMVGLAGFLCFLPDFARDGIKYTVPEDKQFLYGTLLFLAGVLIKGMMNLGLINIQLRILDNEKYTSNDLWTPSGKFWAWCGASICFAVMTVIGFCFFIVPGVVLTLTFQFYPYFLVDKRAGPIQALKASAAITSGALWDLFFFSVILAVIKAVGFFLFMIGAIPTYMFAELSFTHAYQTLLANTPKETLAFLSGEQSSLASEERKAGVPQVILSTILSDQKADQAFGGGSRLKSDQPDKLHNLEDDKSG